MERWIGPAARTQSREESMHKPPQGKAASVAGAGGEAPAVATSTKRDDVKSPVDTVAETFGQIDVMLDEAGLMPLSG